MIEPSHRQAPQTDSQSAEQGLTSQEATRLLAQYGPNSLEDKKTNRWMKLLKFFTSPIAWMIEAAALISILVGDYSDFAIIIGLLFFNAGLGFWEEHQAANSLAALKSSLAQKAKVLRDQRWFELPAHDLVPGDIVQIRLGDICPADLKLISGDYLSCDQAALTGESLPVSKKVGDSAYSGSIVKKGEMIGQVTATGARTYFGKTALLVQGAGAKSHFEKAVMRIGDFLIFMALGLSLVLVAVQLSRHAPLLSVAEFVLILLVASIPVAMPAVLSVTMAMGARLLALKKVIVSRLEAIEELAGMDILCSDKTGTLTQNKLSVGELQPWGQVQASELLLAAKLASRASDQDPIDNAILANGAIPPGYKQAHFVPFDPVAKRTEATIQGPDGKMFSVAKGTPQILFQLAKLSGDVLEKAHEAVQAVAKKGYRSLAVIRADENGDWRYLGLIPLFDPPQPDSASTIDSAKKLGITVKMVTGDNLAIATEIGSQLGIGHRIQSATDLLSQANPGELIEAADGFAQVFPEHKYQIVKILQSRSHIVGMTGDGANDAPALKQADVGIAVSGATDAARAAAALVLTAPGLSVIIEGIKESRRIFQRMTSYSIYRIAMTINLMFFIVIATITYGDFPLTALMIILLAILDDLPILTIAYDQAEVSPRPMRWNLHRLLYVATLLGLLAVFESFGMLYLGESLLQLPKETLQSLMFLQLLLGGHLLLFVVRSAKSFWSKPWPSRPLTLTILSTQIVAVLVCYFGLGVPKLTVPQIFLVWFYSIVWMLFLDIAKVAAVRYLDHMNEV